MTHREKVDRLVGPFLYAALVVPLVLLVTPYRVPDDPSCGPLRFWQLFVVYLVGYPLVVATLCLLRPSSRDWLLRASWRETWRRAHPHLIWLPLVVFLLSGPYILFPNILTMGLWATSKSTADARQLASAVSMYAAHMGRLPPRLSDLTIPASNAKGEVMGPWLTNLPRTPGLAAEYQYEPHPDGTFVVSGTSVGRCGWGGPFTVRIP